MVLHRCVLLVGLVACGGKQNPQPAAAVSTPDTAQPAPASGEQPGCEPGRCLEDISRVVLGQRAKARACYDAMQARTPGVGGRLIMNFTVDPDGNVVEVSQGMQDGQLEDPELVACVGEVMKQLKFAASGKGKTTRAYHRFEFSP